MNQSIHRYAERDLVEAVHFYKQEAAAGVACRFGEEFERVARLLEEFPAIGAPGVPHLKSWAKEREARRDARRQ